MTANVSRRRRDAPAAAQLPPQPATTPPARCRQGDSAQTRPTLITSCHSQPAQRRTATMQLSLRSIAGTKPTFVQRRHMLAVPSQPRAVLARSHPTKADIENVEKKVEAAIKEAESTCKDSDAAHCAAAWDNVEELSAAVAHKKVAFQNDPVSTDPLEEFCEGNPDADECRIYDD